MFLQCPMTHLLVFLLVVSVAYSAHELLSKPLLGDDGRIYVCSHNNFFAFESNGSIAWTMHLDYKCNLASAPLHGGLGKIYLVADNRILMISYGNIGTSEPEAEVFFGPGSGHTVETEIIGLSVTTSGSNLYINVKNRGLFAYHSHGRRLLWSVGPVLYQFGHRQGCKKNLKDCYFTSVPVLDQCEASIYISNTEGELYCFSVHSHYFRWIQDFSSLDKNFTITPGNNGHLYVTVPAKALVLALDVFSGNVLWQRSIGPLSKVDSAPSIIMIHLLFTTWNFQCSLRLKKKALDRTITKLEQKAIVWAGTAGLAQNPNLCFKLIDDKNPGGYKLRKD